MGLYEQSCGLNSGHLTQTEVHLYGSSRLGIYNINRDLINPPTGEITIFERGKKFFELSNHLGNVLATVSDKKIGVDANTDGTVDYYTADVISAQDYYPFGQLQPGRQYGTKGRYGFNGKENDNEVKGMGNQQDYGMRIYDPRLGRFLSVDPIAKDYPELTPYQFASNTPIQAIDLDGLEAKTAIEGFAKAMKYGYNSLVIQMVDAGHGDVQTQIYSLKAHTNSADFTKLKTQFLSEPDKLTDNFFAEYEQIPRAQATEGKLSNGDEIAIWPSSGFVHFTVVPVFVRAVQADETTNSFNVAFATLEGHPEAGYVSFSGTFNEKDKTVEIKIITETREVWQISRLGPSRGMQQRQWAIVIGNFRKFLNIEKKDAEHKIHIETYKYDKDKPCLLYTSDAADE